MALSGSALADRILGGWLGRIAGNMLGKPVENGDYWTRDRNRPVSPPCRLPSR